MKKLSFIFMFIVIANTLGFTQSITDYPTDHPTTVPTINPTEIPTAVPTPTALPTDVGVGYWNYDIHVYDAGTEGNPPIENAYVRGSNLLFGSDEAYTDADGNCTLSVLANSSGTVSLYISASGFLSYSGVYPAMPPTGSLSIGLEADSSITPMPTTEPTPSPVPTEVGDGYWTYDIHVYDADTAGNPPIYGARVAGSSLIGSDEEFTDADGNCTIAVFVNSAGTVYLLVSAPGFFTFSGVYPAMPYYGSLSIGLEIDPSTPTPVPTPTLAPTPTPVLQDLPWIEDFNDLSSGITEDTGATAWTSLRPDGIFQVCGNRFMINGGRTEGVWTSEVIDISYADQVRVSVDLDDMYNNKEQSDYVKVYYTLDGGSEQFIGKVNNDIRAQTISRGGISGSTIQIVIRARVSSPVEYYYWDNVTVEEQ